MKTALSPCPNDTFLFHAWIEGVVGQELPIVPSFADIQQLNLWALQATYPLIKLSFPCFSKVVEKYQLLPIGSALGFHCGPKIVAKKLFPLNELSQKKVAIPGKETTAHFLMERLLGSHKAKRFCLYHEVFSLIEKGEVDCGLIIHESRFTFQEAGCVEIVDLGELWHRQTHLPLPLGGLAIARSLPDATKAKVIDILHASLASARTLPNRCISFILKHSQEKDRDIVKKHIDLYVNQETEHLSEKGIESIEQLLDHKLPKDWLYGKNV